MVILCFIISFTHGMQWNNRNTLKGNSRSDVRKREKMGNVNNLAKIRNYREPKSLFDSYEINDELKQLAYNHHNLLYPNSDEYLEKYDKEADLDQVFEHINAQNELSYENELELSEESQDMIELIKSVLLDETQPLAVEKVNNYEENHNSDSVDVLSKHEEDLKKSLQNNNKEGYNTNFLNNINHDTIIVLIRELLNSGMLSKILQDIEKNIVKYEQNNFISNIGSEKIVDFIRDSLNSGVLSKYITYLQTFMDAKTKDEFDSNEMKVSSINMLSKNSLPYEGERKPRLLNSVDIIQWNNLEKFTETLIKSLSSESKSFQKSSSEDKHLYDVNLDAERDVDGKLLSKFKNIEPISTNDNVFPRVSETQIDLPIHPEYITSFNDFVLANNEDQIKSDDYNSIINSNVEELYLKGNRLYNDLKNNNNLDQHLFLLEPQNPVSSQTNIINPLGNNELNTDIYSSTNQYPENKINLSDNSKLDANQYFILDIDSPNSQFISTNYPLDSRSGRKYESSESGWILEKYAYIYQPVDTMGADMTTLEYENTPYYNLVDLNNYILNKGTEESISNNLDNIEKFEDQVNSIDFENVQSNLQFMEPKFTLSTNDISDVGNETDSKNQPLNDIREEHLPHNESLKPNIQEKQNSYSERKPRLLHTVQAIKKDSIYDDFNATSLDNLHIDIQPNLILNASSKSKNVTYENMNISGSLESNKKESEFESNITGNNINPAKEKIINKDNDVPDWVYKNLPPHIKHSIDRPQNPHSRSVRSVPLFSRIKKSISDQIGDFILEEEPAAPLFNNFLYPEIYVPEAKVFEQNNRRELNRNTGNRKSRHLSFHNPHLREPPYQLQAILENNLYQHVNTEYPLSYVNNKVPPNSKSHQQLYQQQQQQQQYFHLEPIQKDNSFIPSAQRNYVPDFSTNYDSNKNIGSNNLNGVHFNTMESPISQKKSNKQWQNYPNIKKLKLKSDEDIYEGEQVYLKYSKKTHSREIIDENAPSEVAENSNELNNSDDAKDTNKDRIIKGDFNLNAVNFNTMESPISQKKSNKQLQNYPNIKSLKLKSDEDIYESEQVHSKYSKKTHSQEIIDQNAPSEVAENFNELNNSDDAKHTNKDRIIKGDFKYHNEGNDTHLIKYLTKVDGEKDPLNYDESNEILENIINSETNENNFETSSKYSDDYVSKSPLYSRQSRSEKIFDSVKHNIELDDTVKNIRYKNPHIKSSSIIIDSQPTMYYDKNFDQVSIDSYRYPSKSDDNDGSINGESHIKLPSGTKYVYGTTTGSEEQRRVSPLGTKLQLYTGHGHSRVPSMLDSNSRANGPSSSIVDKDDDEKYYRYFNDIKNKGPMNIKFADEESCETDENAEKNDAINVHINPICDINDHETITTSSTTVLNREDTTVVTTVTKSTCYKGTDITTLTKETKSTENNFYDYYNRKNYNDRRNYGRDLKSPEKHSFNVHTVSTKNSRRGRLLPFPIKETNLKSSNEFEVKEDKYYVGSNDEYNYKSVQAISPEAEFFERENTEISDETSEGSKIENYLLSLNQNRGSQETKNNYDNNDDYNDDEYNTATADDDADNNDDDDDDDDNDDNDDDDDDYDDDDDDEDDNDDDNDDDDDDDDVDDDDDDEDSAVAAANAGDDDDDDNDVDDKDKEEITDNGEIHNEVIHFCDDYNKFSANHSAVIDKNDECKITSTRLSQSTIDQILIIHNMLRAKIARGYEYSGPQPPAANMKELRWNTELAHVAQAWASQCQEEHDCQECRGICSRDYLVGQNIFTQLNTSLSDWDMAIHAWYDEVDYLPVHEAPEDDGDNNRLQTAMNYAQVAWGLTSEIGCGIAHYELKGDEDDVLPKVTYVCNYGPGLPTQKSSLYIEGIPASMCEKGESKSYPGLCA